MTSAAPTKDAPVERQQEAAKTDKIEKTDFHFGGPIGATVLTVLLPILTVYLWMSIHHHGGSLFVPTAASLAQIPVPTARGSLYFFGFLAIQVFLDVVVPGRRVDGVKQRDGVVMSYKLNGLTSLIITVIGVGSLLYTGVVRGTDVKAELGSMLAVATLFTFAFSVFLYFYGFRSKRNEQRSGILIYDFFMGTSLNPRIGSVDLKFFLESKIGLSLWLAIVMAMASAQWEATGAVSLPMALVLGFQLIYVTDFYVFEDAMLSTWDINYENYGFMLAQGFLIWMPFNFSLQAQYLVNHNPQIPVLAVVGLVVLNIAGYVIFRSSNLQKHHFRTRPAVKIWGRDAEFIETKRGTRLLTSGWWGVSRHSNYLGDLMMALAWCMTTGFSHITPYFYFIYFAPLLIDRERRDHRVCQKKYGKDWDTYCKKVPYRILPWIY